ncbi:TIR domain-containing protein [Brassicibacter mesophilus]|uniref:TIR domain-containing protein n=1 Tax=Brassicibacter mesophilus TaxID=745119 RepID=UPI003D205E3D
MGYKIFISYKYADNDVNHIVGEWYENNTVRDYVDKLEEYLNDKSDHIYKGESDGEDLSKLSEDSIWKKLKDRIYDSTLTIVMISKNMKESWEVDKNQWIPWEISYSLKEVSRKNRSGNSVSSKTNAVIAIIIPDSNNSYEYYTYNKNCCDSGCRMLMTNTLFGILKNNMFNMKDAETKECSDGSKIYYGDSSYVTSVKWDDFINNIDAYIDKAYELRDNIDNYEIFKEV